MNVYSELTGFFNSFGIRENELRADSMFKELREDSTLKDTRVEGAGWGPILWHAFLSEDQQTLIKMVVVAETREDKPKTYRVHRTYPIQGNPKLAAAELLSDLMFEDLQREQAFSSFKYEVEDRAEIAKRLLLLYINKDNLENVIEDKRLHNDRILTIGNSIVCKEDGDLVVYKDGDRHTVAEEVSLARMAFDAYSLIGSSLDDLDDDDLGLGDFDSRFYPISAWENLGVTFGMNGSVTWLGLPLDLDAQFNSEGLVERLGSVSGGSFENLFKYILEKFGAEHPTVVSFAQKYDGNKFLAIHLKNLIEGVDWVSGGPAPKLLEVDHKHLGIDHFFMDAGRFAANTSKPFRGRVVSEDEITRREYFLD